MSKVELTKGSKGSVSGWIAKMRKGDPIAISNLSARYFAKLAEFVDLLLRGGVHISDDGDDIANSVLLKIILKVAEGKFARLQDRDDLWLVMIVIAQHAVVEKQQRALRRKKKLAEFHTMTDLLETYNLRLQEFLDDENSPERLMEIVDCWEELLKTLPDEPNREVARLKLQGYSNREIGEKLKMIPRTVDRKVETIAQRWLDFFTARFDD